MGDKGLMPYFGVDDGFAFHRKAVRAGNAALGLWVRAGAWCNQQLTDGFVPHEIAEVLGTAPQVARLVAADLWHEVPGGYQFHEFTEEKRNFSRAEVLEKRAKDRERKAKARTAKSEKRQVTVDGHSGSPNGIPEESQEESALSHPIPSHPKRKRQTTSVSTRKRGKRIPDDFTVTPEMVEWARERVPHVDGRIETEKFINYWQGKSGANATKVDWEATWRNWMLNAADRSSPRSSSQEQMHPTDQAVLRLLNPDTPLRALPGGSQ